MQVKIILDTDGTLTDFNKFVKENAISYFQKKYNLDVVYPDKLEIEEIFDIKNVLQQKYSLTDSEAEIKLKQLLDEYWISLRFLKFSLFENFRPGVKEVINDLIKNGYDVQVHTSRAKTCENSIIGDIARKFTILQYWNNGIFLSPNKFHFYNSDIEKINNIINTRPDLVFDDKNEIIDKLSSEGIKCICVMGNHNKKIHDSDNVKVVKQFSKDEINIKISELIGKRKMDYYSRESKSDIYYQKMRFLIPIILKYFNPIVLNEKNIIKDVNDGIIYAPNHRSTLDPVVITTLLDKNIHWAALLRFFQAKDSIFNNSKNHFLCEITANLFKSLEYFPIDRKSDNPEANNFESIKDMNNFLRINSQIGIFGEGTTRRPEGQDFGTFDDSFLLLAKRNNSWIQPITSLWIKDLKLKNKVIINFGEPFKVENMSIDEAMTKFLKIQEISLQENVKLYNNLDTTENKIKKYFKNNE